MNARTLSSWLLGAGPVVAATLAASAVGETGCSNAAEEEPTLTREQLLDPSTCAQCHEAYVREWSGSMHAYASEDPVFVAMNKRFQRESGGSDPDFCVTCHAPMAVVDGRTKDGSNLADLPKAYQGVTCFFCHTAESVGALHNNGVTLSASPTMRGGFSNPTANTAHRSSGSSLHDGARDTSAKLCGSCHDIVTPNGAHIERTYDEWSKSLFARQHGQTCNQCHMKPPRDEASSGDILQPVANYPGVPARVRHPHTFAGIDRALTPFPNMEEQTDEIQKFLNDSLQTSLCVSIQGQASRFRVILDSVGPGHAFPSGAVSDRRVWVELKATFRDEVILQSGVVAVGEAVHEGAHDPNLWLMRDRVFGPDGSETHQFAQASCYESRLMPYPTTSNPADPEFFRRNVAQDFLCDGGLCPRVPDKVTMQVWIMPIGLEVLQDLVASGDLEPAIVGQMKPMTVGPLTTWTIDTADRTPVGVDGVNYTCVSLNQQNFRADTYPLVPVNTCQPPASP